jgi:hypothetical protein
LRRYDAGFSNRISSPAGVESTPTPPDKNKPRTQII